MACTEQKSTCDTVRARRQRRKVPGLGEAGFGGQSTRDVLPKADWKLQTFL